MLLKILTFSIGTLLIPLLSYAQGVSSTTSNANAGSHASGGSPPIENHPCYQPDDSRAIASASRTNGSCRTMSCPGGCCRYHIQFLVCDTSNDYTHLACVCNELTATNGTSTSSTGDGRDGNNNGSTPPDSSTIIVEDPQNPPQQQPLPALPPPTLPPVASSAIFPAPPPERGNPSAGGRPSSSPRTCENGSVWQTLNLPFVNCASSSDCNGVTTTDGSNRRTCCKRTFCWCGAFDIEADECDLT